MFKHLVKLTLAFIAISLIQSVIISHRDNDIRDSILSSFQDRPKKELFKVYHFLYEKKYDLNSEEGINRYRIFKSNLKFIESQNAKNLGYTLGISDLTDLTADEFRQSKLGAIAPEKIEANIQKFLNTEQAEDKFEIHTQDEDEDEKLIQNSKFSSDSVLQQTKINWTSKMNPATNQSGCGSCWAFATVHAIEGNYNIQFGNSPGFSPQQLVDCDKISHGCQGGYPDKALNYIINKGLAYQNAYPYISGSTGQADTCRDPSVTTNQVVTSYDSCPYMRCTQTRQRGLLAKGPLIVYIDGDGRSEGNSIYQHYKSGVLEMPCIQINHAIVLTGVDRDEKGEYLIGMNSWGPGWGEKGHFRIRSRPSDKTCFMETFGLLPKVKQTFNPVPPPPVPGCLRIFSECRLKGQVREVCGNTPAITDFPVMAGYDIGKFSTVKVFFQQANCRGSFYTFSNRSFSCFADNKLVPLVNSIKSLIVDEQEPPKGCVWLYDDNCLSGNKVEVCDDINDLSDPKWNFGNKTSSIKFGPGVSEITVYLDKDYEGSYTPIKGDRYGFDGTWLNKDIESLKIVKS